MVSKTKRLERLAEIRAFTYAPEGDNFGRDALQHTEVIALAAHFLTESETFQNIVLARYPFILIDESQDTMKPLMEALLTFEARHRGRIALGLLGDTMRSGSGYVRSSVLLEFGARSTGEPAQRHEVVCDFSQALPELLTPVAAPRVMMAERTFWEKATAIHAYCLRGVFRGGDLTPRELAVKYTDEKRYFVSESSVYRILSAEDLITAPAHVVIKAADEFRDKTARPNELWQTDFTYLKVIGWGWFYLSTILDDYSRYIIAWKLCTTMKAKDVTDTLELALEASGCSDATVVHKPRLLSDNGASYVAADLAEYLKDNGMDHVRGAPHHPQTQGKIERWHQTMKNRVLLENYFLPGDLERQIGAFVDHYNNHRYHESLANLTPADVYHGRGAKILKMREEIKKQTIRQRRLQHQAAAA